MRPSIPFFTIDAVNLIPFPVIDQSERAYCVSEQHTIHPNPQLHQILQFSSHGFKNTAQGRPMSSQNPPSSFTNTMAVSLLHDPSGKRCASSRESNYLLNLTPHIDHDLTGLQASRLSAKQSFHPLLIQRHQPKAHRRNTEALPPTIQKSGRHAPPGSGTTATRFYEH